MKFACLQENLAKGLGIVARAVPAKSALPILSNVLLSAEKGRLRFAATSLDTTIVTYVGASVEESGEITVPAKLLKDLVSHLSPSTVDCSLKDDILHIVSGTATAKINGVSAKDYPELPTFPKGDKVLEVSPQDFITGVSLVAFAAAIDTTRPIFSGILMTSDKDTLTLAASDGFRLSEHVSGVVGGGLSVPVIIPAKTLLEVARIFAASEDSIRIALDENNNLVLFECGDTMVATRILDGQFPDYGKIVPRETSLKVSLSATELLEAVRLASVFSTDDSRAIKLVFDAGGFINLMASTQELGEHTSKFDAVVEGDTLEVIFSSKYLLDFLTNLKSERVLVETAGPTSPCLFRPEEGEGFIHIIMPIQLQQ